jgi:peptidoglycan L-alanyl-D-glutamate endopeptidase CwlK
MSRNIDDLHPTVAKLCVAFIDACKQAGIDIILTSTYRSIDEQNKLYAIGRTVRGANPSVFRPMGATVTNAKGGSSFHNYHLAFDFLPNLHGKPADWGDTATFTLCGEIGERCGLEWAGRWTTFRELAHLQFTGGLSLADLQIGRALPILPERA